MSPLIALRLCELGLAVSVGLQSLESLVLRAHFAAPGTWRWKTLRKEWRTLPRILNRSADGILADDRFPKLLSTLLIAATLLVALSGWVLGIEPTLAERRLFFPELTLILFLGSLAVAARFRGAFNGGSDTATVNFLLGCLLGEWVWPKLGLGWIAVQITLSYWIAGAVKARSSRWWNGKALQEFLHSNRYGVPQFVKAASQSLAVCSLASIAVIVFEVLFPSIFGLSRISLPVDPNLIVAAVLAAGALFHLANFWIFGLNRFFFAWLAGYPAVIWWALYSQK